MLGGEFRSWQFFFSSVEWHVKDYCVKEQLDQYLDAFFIVDPANHPHAHLCNLTEGWLFQTNVSQDLDHPFAYADASVLQSHTHKYNFFPPQTQRRKTNAISNKFLHLAQQHIIYHQGAAEHKREAWTSHEPSWTFPWQQPQQFQWVHFSLAQDKDKIQCLCAGLPCWHTWHDHNWHSMLLLRHSFMNVLPSIYFQVNLILHCCNSGSLWKINVQYFLDNIDWIKQIDIFV